MIKLKWVKNVVRIPCFISLRDNDKNNNNVQCNCSIIMLDI